VGIVVNSMNDVSIQRKKKLQKETSYYDELRKIKKHLEVLEKILEKQNEIKGG
jgi:hypothetical protein